MANLEHVEDQSKHVKMPGDTQQTYPQKAATMFSSAAGNVFAEVSCAIPSFAAASELVSTPYSCLVMKTHRRHVALPPMYLNKKKTGLQGELQAELLKFSPRLQGVPLAYDNIQIVRHFGDIYDDSGYIHMDIEANFIIFQPKKGQRLLGKVNKLGVSHVGCLVHGCFNASIPKPSLVSVDTWWEAGPRIGSELEFEVIALDADTAGVLLIRGRLDKTRVQEMLSFSESGELSVSVDQAELEDTAVVAEPNDEFIEDNSIKKKKKKKKKKKDKIKEEIEEEAALSFFQGDCHVTLEPEEKKSGTKGEKKKKKKEKRIKEEECHTPLELNGKKSDTKDENRKKKKEKRIKEEVEVQLSPMEIHTSDSSGYHSDKPNKKRKHEKEDEITESFTQDAGEPKSKKKKKRKSDV
ncbi:DNA-directed RNA polymerase I subunit RPA43 [Syngnathoides biaculeatus]|uniref:DNA-directed RNA polymerase I subunit RPA43 n=1 Tax=Syngnathoides biaculeatus TaxID=300417 RepID=UPI002ADD9393|nr:DNA-directed RNA polymerase I subunit RPA43 [Syngnathoides biaculeatus]